MAGRWNPRKHPRDSQGRFRPKYVKGSLARNTYVGRGGKYHGVKTGAEFELPSGAGVLVKGIVGYKPPKSKRVA